MEMCKHNDRYIDADVCNYRIEVTKSVTLQNIDTSQRDWILFLLNELWF